MLEPKNDLRRLLHRLADAVADSAERDSRLAGELQELFSAGPTTQAGKKRRPKHLPPPEDPFDIFRTKGADGFKVWVESHEIESLRAIVRQHRLDPSRLSDKWRTKERFVALLCERVPARFSQGDVFRREAAREAPGRSDRSPDATGGTGAPTS